MRIAFTSAMRARIWARLSFFSWMALSLST
jgi:hypothetical protein